MRMTKGMKKALSWVLAGALVITGANFGATKASAADEMKKTDITSMKVTGTYVPGSEVGTTLTYNGAAVKDADASKEGTYTIDASLSDGGVQNVGYWESDKAFSVKNAYIMVNDTYKFKLDDASSSPSWDKKIQVAYKNIWNGFSDGETVYTSEDGKAALVYDKTAALIVLKVKEEAPITNPTSGSAVTSETGATSDTVAASGDMTKFNVGFNYVGDDTWAESIWGEPSVEVTKDGDYTLSYKAKNASEDLYMMILSTDLYNGSTVEGFSLGVTKITVGGKEVKTTANTGLWGFSDNQAKNAFRYNVRNPFNGHYQENCVDGVENTVADMFGGAYVPVKAGDEITVSFNVKGMDPNGKKVTYDDHECAPYTVAPIHPETPTTTDPGKKPTQPTKKPAAATLKVAKSAVVVAAGKSVTVKATTNQKSIKATAKSAKVAKVKVTGKKIKISVPKKAVKGASTVVTVKAGSKTAKIKVTVKNPAKKIKAAKKTVKVKKGKKAKITFKVTATNKKKAAADTIKVTSKNKKVAKVTKYSVKKGKAIVTVKGVKKGKKTTVTLKIGKKSAKVTVRVK